MTEKTTPYQVKSSPVVKGHEFRTTHKPIPFTLAIPEDLARRAETLKQTTFYNLPYTEMYHRLIQLGIEQFQKKKEHESYAKLS